MDMLTQKFITKRNGTQEPFNQDKIDKAIQNAFKSCGYKGLPAELETKYKEIDFSSLKTVEEIQDKLEEILFGTGYKDVYNHFVTYRANHALLREIKTKSLFDSIIGAEKNDVTRENGNMNSDTPAGMMMKFASETTKAFSDRYVLESDIKKAQDDNLLHIHDKDYYLTRSLTCLTGDTNIQLKDERGHIINTKLNYFDNEFNDSGDLQLIKPSNYIYIQGRNGWTKVTGVSRHALTEKEKLYKIKFGKGVELKITDSHLIPVIIDGEEKLIRVSELKPGMNVLKIGLFNESAIQDEYIDIINEINDSCVDVKILISNIRDLIWYLKYKYQVMNLRGWLGIPGSTNYPRGAKYITIEDYNRIRAEFDIPYEVLSTLTVKVYGGKDSLPIYLPITNELAEIFGYLHSEGSISFSQKSGSYQISFCNYDENMRNRFKESWNKIFTNKLTEFKHDNKVVGLTGSSKLLSMLFSKVLGKKANSYDITIPNFILNGNNDIKWHYLSALIDGDGCVKANIGKSINYTTVSRNFAEQLVILFQSLGVESIINENYTFGRLTKFGDIVSQSNTNTQSIKITGYENIEKVLSNLKCIKQNSIDAYYAEKPKKAVVNTPTKIIDIIELKNNNQLVYDIETVEHWWVANNVIVHNCLQHPLDKILQGGFQSGHGSARPAKRIETAAIQACISMETIQNEMHGGQAIPAFDFYMAPYVRLTYIEEVNKIRELMVDEENNGYWDEIRNADIKDYTIEKLPWNLVPTHHSTGITQERIKQLAINNTVKRVHQAMESFIHNMNSIHSRGGNQVVFSSINYGTDTSAEGRCIIRELLKSTERGVGNNATAIFPIQIWKMKAGVSVNPGDPNYDLYQYSLKVAARRFFPNYLNLDSSFNKDEAWDANDPKRYMHEVATMGALAGHEHLYIRVNGGDPIDVTIKDLFDICKANQEIVGRPSQIWYNKTKLNNTSNPNNRIKQEKSNMPNQPGVYSITYLPEDVTYIGSTSSLSRRTAEHKCNIRKTGGIDAGAYFGDSDLNNYKFEVLEITENYKEIEKKYIEETPNINFRGTCSKYYKTIHQKDKNRIYLRPNFRQDLTIQQDLIDLNELDIKVLDRDNKWVKVKHIFKNDKHNSPFMMHIFYKEDDKELCLTCTEDHPLWTGSCFTRADQLKKGDNIYRADGKELEIVDICWHWCTVDSYDIGTETGSFIGSDIIMHNCRTRVYENKFGPKTSVGRGNISFSTINLVKIAIQVAIDDGFLLVTKDGYTRNGYNNSPTDQTRRLVEFRNRVIQMVDLTAKQLDQRFQFQKQALAKQFPLLMKGMWVGSENLNPEDTIESVINQGTLGIGFIGLAEAFVALTGKHHAENEYLQSHGLDLLKKMHERSAELSEQYQHNYSILATPAEGLSGKFTKKDKKEFGEIVGVTDREYYTNSNHVPVYYKCTASHKAKIECPYHKYTRGGHIFYVEADYDPTKNPEAIDRVNRIAIDNDGGYISFNHNQGRCNYCNFESDDPALVHGSTCPNCGRKGAWDQLSRVTGYLISTTDRWNNGKINELNDRVQHM